MEDPAVTTAATEVPLAPSAGRPLSSSIALVLANLIPLAGVLFLGWDIGMLMVLFWSENLVIGFFNLARMFTSQPASVVNWILKLPLMAFFCVHYGMFCFVHGAFVMLLFAGGRTPQDLVYNSPLDAMIWMLSRPEIALALLGIALSHGVSFVFNYLWGGEYRSADPAKLMMQPYTRVIVLHLTLIFGAMLSLGLGSNMASLLVLVLLKIAVDLRAHWMEHFRLKGVPGEQLPPLLRPGHFRQRIAEARARGRS